MVADARTQKLGAYPLLFSRLSVFVASFVFSLSLLRTPLLFDEVFGLFTYSVNLGTKSETIIATALDASVQGWNQGRFISPLLHLLGNLGFSLSYWVSEWLKIDPLLSYGLMRSVLFGSVSVLISTLTYHLLPDPKQSPARVLFSTLAGLILPAIVVSSRLFSSPRSAPWAYTGVLLISLALFIWTVRTAGRSDKNWISKTITFTSMAIIGFLFGTTYELTQLLAPISVVLFVAVRTQLASGWGETLTSIRKTTFSAPVFLFMVSYLVPFAVIRIDSALKCSAGCYAPANIKADHISFITVFERLLTHLPFVSARVAFEENFGLENIKPFLLISISMAALFVALGLGRTMAKISGINLYRNLELRRTGLLLILVGLLINGLVSVGMASSEDVQNNPLPIGASSRDSIFQYSGLALLMVGVICFVYSFHFRNITSRKIVSISITLLLSLSAGVGFAVNQKLSENGAINGGKFLLERFSQEISSPDSSPYGDQRRCSFVRQKLKEYPEWEGHDRLLFAGLNNYMQVKNNTLFCSTPENEMFRDYGK